MSTPFDESIYESTAHHFVKSSALLFEGLYQRDPGTHEFKRFMSIIEEYAGITVHVIDIPAHVAALEELLAACRDMSEFEIGNYDFMTYPDEETRPDEVAEVRQALDQEVNRCVIQLL